MNNRELICSKIELFVKSLKENDSITLNEKSKLMDYQIDSIKFVQLIIYLESEFKIEIPDEYLLQTVMNEVGKIIDIIESCDPIIGT